jgi:hypothetical protein
VSGDVRVDSVARGETSLRSVSGDMTVGVAPGATLWMDVSSVSGDTRSDLDPMDAAAGGGGVDLRIRARSTSGDIRLMRAEAPAPV